VNSIEPKHFIFNTLSGGTSPKIESVALTIDLRWVGSLDRFGKPLARRTGFAPAAR
jgi:hypothetical protein